MTKFDRLPKKAALMLLLRGKSLLQLNHCNRGIPDYVVIKSSWMVASLARTLLLLLLLTTL